MSSGSQARIGRQRIIFDNERFIGGVGWRQNEQTFDALSFSHTAGNGFNFTWAYIDKVKRIFGSEVDVSFSRKFVEKYGLLLKAASFDSRSPDYGDTTKFWVQLTADF